MATAAPTPSRCRSLSARGSQTRSGEPGRRPRPVPAVLGPAFLRLLYLRRHTHLINLGGGGH